MVIYFEYGQTSSTSIAQSFCSQWSHNIPITLFTGVKRPGIRNEVVIVIFENEICFLSVCNDDCIKIDDLKCENIFESVQIFVRRDSKALKILLQSTFMVMVNKIWKLTFSFLSQTLAFFKKVCAFENSFNEAIRENWEKCRKFYSLLVAKVCTS